MKKDRDDFLLFVDEENIFIWHAVIYGPKKSPYEDGTFKLVIDCSTDYPVRPPTVTFLSKMWHPNIYSNGKICLNILAKDWRINIDLELVVSSIRVFIKQIKFWTVSNYDSLQELLTQPNTESPGNVDAAWQYVNDPTAYNKNVRDTVEQSLTL